MEAFDGLIDSEPARTQTFWQIYDVVTKIDLLAAPELDTTLRFSYQELNPLLDQDLTELDIRLY